MTKDEIARVKERIIKSLDNVPSDFVIRHKKKMMAMFNNTPFEVYSLFNFFGNIDLWKKDKGVLEKRLDLIEGEKNKETHVLGSMSLDVFDKVELVGCYYDTVERNDIAKEVTRGIMTDNSDIRNYMETVKNEVIKRLHNVEKKKDISHIELNFEFTLNGRKFYYNDIIARDEFKKNIAKRRGIKGVYYYEKMENHPYYKRYISAKELCEHLQDYRTTNSLPDDYADLKVIPDEQVREKISDYLKHYCNNSKMLEVHSSGIIKEYENANYHVTCYQCDKGIYVIKKTKPKSLKEQPVISQFLFEDNKFVRDKLKDIKNITCISMDFVPLMLKCIQNMEMKQEQEQNTKAKVRQKL